MRGCFVTGTDTGVGKTVLGAAIAAALTRPGPPVRALKPVITGLDEHPTRSGHPTTSCSPAVTGEDPAESSLAAYGPAGLPASGRRARRGADRARRARRAHRAAAPRGRRRSALIVEGVGGLLVPLGPDD